VKWDNDAFRYEKYLIFDAVLEFSKTHEGESFSEVSIKDLADFADYFCEQYLSPKDAETK